MTYRPGELNLGERPTALDRAGAGEAVWSLNFDHRIARSITMEPDPEWRFTDAAGHTHRWDVGKLPSLEFKRACPWWHHVLRALGINPKCRCQSWRQCSECGEIVEPKRRELTAIAVGPQELTGTVCVSIEEAAELAATGPKGELLRLERFFPELEGEAIVVSVEGSRPRVAMGPSDLGVHVELQAVGTVHIRTQTYAQRIG